MYNPDYSVPVSWIIEEYLECHSFSLEDFSTITGIKSSRISELIENDFVDITKKELENVCKFINLDVETFGSIIENYINSKSEKN